MFPHSDWHRSSTSNWIMWRPRFTNMGIIAGNHILTHYDVLTAICLTGWNRSKNIWHVSEPLMCSWPLNQSYLIWLATRDSSIHGYVPSLTYSGKERPSGTSLSIWTNNQMQMRLPEMCGIWEDLRRRSVTDYQNWSKQQQSRSRSLKFESTQPVPTSIRPGQDRVPRKNTTDHSPEHGYPTSESKILSDMYVGLGSTFFPSRATVCLCSFR